MGTIPDILTKISLSEFSVPFSFMNGFWSTNEIKSSKVYTKNEPQ